MVYSFEFSLSLFLLYFKLPALSFIIVFDLILCVVSCFAMIYKITKGANKRKRDIAASQSQMTEQNLQLITNTNFHVGNQNPRPFHQIYEEFKAGQAPTDRKEREVWENVKKSGLP